MSAIKEWITGIVVIIIFMSIVELVLPDNSFKKYAKLATGLIVIIAILSPILRFASNGGSTEKLIESYSSMIYPDSNEEVIKSEVTLNNQTIEVFKNNLKTQIQDYVFSYLDKQCQICEIEIEENTESKAFGQILHIKIRMLDDKEVSPIDKIVIAGDRNTGDKKQAHVDEEVLMLLKEKFGVDNSTVEFVK